MDNFIKAVDELVKTLAANPYIGLGGFLIGIISLLFSYYVARRDKKIKKLSHVLVSSNIITNNQTIFPKLLITYNDEKLDNLTVSKVKIFNPGTETILPVDIAKNDPIRFSLQSNDTVRMLDFGVVYSSDPNNNFRITQFDDFTIEINFDFVEPEDEFVFQILHTGKDSSVIKVNGTVVGAKDKFSEKASLDIKSQKWGTSRTRAIATGIILAFLFGFISFSSLYFGKNFLISGMCLVPTLFFVYGTIKIATSKTKRSPRLAATAFRSALRRTLSELDDEDEEIPDWKSNGKT